MQECGNAGMLECGNAGMQAMRKISAGLAESDSEFLGEVEVWTGAGQEGKGEY